MQYQKQQFTNGLRVIVAPMENTQAVTLLVLVGVGSKYETKKINGISHFLEHLFFKGTKSRPKPGQVHRDRDSIGAQHNAFTSKEVTSFWVKADARHFDLGLDVVSDILLEPLFKKEEIELERGVILQEIAMYEDIPQRKVLDLLEQVLYGDQPAGWDIAGSKEAVQRISRQDIVNYKNSHYTAPNIVVVAAGNINPPDAFKRIKAAFQRMPKKKPAGKKKVKDIQRIPKIKFAYKDSDQTHIAMAMRGYNMFDDKKYALNLMSVIFGGNTSSRLFMEIREKLGLAYYVGSEGVQYTDSGYLLAKAGIPHNALPKVMQKFIAMLEKLRQRGVNEKELKSAKDYIRGQMALSFESSDEVAMFYGEQELFYKKILQPEDILKKIEAVNKDDIMKVAQAVLQAPKTNFAVIGPHHQHLQKQYQRLFAQL